MPSDNRHVGRSGQPNGEVALVCRHETMLTHLRVTSIHSLAAFGEPAVFGNMSLLPSLALLPALKLGQIANEGATMFLFVAQECDGEVLRDRIYLVAQFDDALVTFDRRIFGRDNAFDHRDEIRRVFRRLHVALLALQFHATCEHDAIR